MPKNLEILLQIENREQRLRELDREIAELPRRVAAIEAKAGGARQALEQVRAAQTGSSSQRRQLEGEIEDLRAKISKIRGHSSDVKTNQEYKALLDEIAFAETQIGNHEQRLLEIMEQAEQLAQAAAAAEAEVKVQEAAAGRESATARQQTETARRERQKLAGERNALRSQAEETWLHRFDRVLRMRKQALAAVDHEACGGCRVRLRPQFLQEMALDPERLFVCESCGRILYMEAEVIPH
ncbi:MAG: zinc ribbon domain-containing protein [Terriglobales bacterium]